MSEPEVEAAAETAKDVGNEESQENRLLVKSEEYAKLLEYEKQMYMDMVECDGLMVTAKGLHYDRVLINILKSYSDFANLVLVINFSDWEEKYYKSQLASKYVQEVSNSVTERERIYLKGGIQFVSTRILVVDLLKDRVPVELITGIIVLRAHTIIESCQETFALRLYRQRNKTGFIKAFSSSAESFTIGYGHLEHTMRNLFAKNLFIWPRFHAIVQNSLKPFEPQTIELHVRMTGKMEQLQANILDVMKHLVREIKRINRSIDLEEITVENCVTKKFHKILQAQLDCIWHQLNSQTKLIIADLKILRNIMIATIYSDAVSLYALLRRYRTSEYALSNSGWTLLNTAEQIFKLAKERVYNKNEEFEPEPSPKWEVLKEILSVEIPGDMKRSFPESVEQPKVLILCQDKRSCYQLKQFLTQSGERYLFYQALRNNVSINKLGPTYETILKAKEMNLSKKLFEATQSASTKEKNEQIEHKDLSQLLEDDDIELECDVQENYMLTMTQQDILPKTDKKSQSNSNENSYFETFPELENLDISAVMATTQQPIICIQTFKTDSEGSHALDRLLTELTPQYVIMYHCNVPAIRQLEIYEARRAATVKKRTRVFFLIHARTVEEQSYLTSLRREKQAFEFIIKTKSTMVIAEDQDGKSGDIFTRASELNVSGDANEATRKAGGQEPSSLATEHNRIVVDMREFRSELPCLIHKRGIEIVPVTITIGDYIITPEICVERKSISDLIGSLNSGRLYNQCIQMQRFYAKPILLIEFDQNRPFHLQSKYMLSLNTSNANADIMQKLQLLTLFFPKLRLIWSPNPYATAQLFQEMKIGKDQPDVKKAASLGADDEDGAFDEMKFNSNIHDFLLRLPGVNSKNIYKLMRHGGSLGELLKKSQAEIIDLLDSQENGKMLYDILHVAHLPEKDEESGSTALLAASKQYNTHTKFRRGAATSAALRRGTFRGKK